MTVFSAALLLFLVMDPLGNIPLFLTALKKVDPARQSRVIVRELLVALGFLVFFLFAGRYILELLNLSEPAISAAGGIILFLIAVKMIFPTPLHTLQEESDDEPFIVPLAIPYVAGPSALATELLLMSKEPEYWYAWLGAMLMAWTASSIILFYSSKMRRYLNDKGLKAMERLMGMILITIAVEMFMSGITEYFGK